MANFTPKKILLTGGAGFIGSHFCRYILTHYPEILLVNLDALTYAGSFENTADLIAYRNYHFIKGNICDRALVKEIFENFHIDTVIHFAAESHVDRSIAGPEEFINTNIIGTFTLLEVARECWKTKYSLNESLCRFHHVSTDEVYGALTRGALPFTEKTPYDPHSPYSASKASSDFLVRAYFKTYQLPYTLSNCSNNFGPYQHAEKFIPTVIKSCLAQTPIPIYGDGSNIRDWLYVEDHCQAIDMIIRQAKAGSSYNIGGNCELSNLELAKCICILMDNLYPAVTSCSGLLTFVEDRAGHDWRYAISNDKITQELGWMPSADFNHRLIKTIRWYVNTFNFDQKLSLET